MANHSRRVVRRARQPGQLNKPFALAAPLYWQAGWQPLWLSPGQKIPPPTGHAGYDGRDVTAEDIERWIGEHGGTGNIALRLPRGVIGVDADPWKGPRQSGVMGGATRPMGAAPRTRPRTSSRDDDQSGIQLLQAPAGLHLRGEATRRDQRDKPQGGRPDVVPQIRGVLAVDPPGHRPGVSVGRRRHADRQTAALAARCVDKRTAGGQPETSAAGKARGRRATPIRPIRGLGSVSTGTCPRPRLTGKSLRIG